MRTARPLVAVSSEIGRGHPCYLESVLTALQELGRSVPLTTASGPGWKLARLLYRLGSQGGILTAVYNLLRTSGPPSKLQLCLLDCGLGRRFAGTDATVLVDHPLLAHLLSPVCRVAYIHGEIAAPQISAVPGAWRIFVPLAQTAERLLASGVRHEALSVTGLMIEPALLEQAEPAFKARQTRLHASQSEPLTVGFFTSGAYPKPHLRAIKDAVCSVQAAGHRAIVFAGCKGCCINSCDVRTFGSREEENLATAARFADLDCMVTAAHERTNWAVGLGLPMFCLLPHIGPYACDNFGFAQAQGVCLPLVDPCDFGWELRRLHRHGRLAEMSAAGWGRYALTGARCAAESLLSAG